MNLYELTEEYKRIEEMLDTINDMKAAGEDVSGFEADVLKEFIDIKGNLYDKIESIAKFITNLEADSTQMTAEIARIKERKDRATKKIEYLTERLLKPAMTLIEGHKAVGNLFTVSLRKSEAVNIVDESLVPMEYKSEKVSISCDKVTLKKVIKSGVTVPGVEIVEHQNVQIK